MAVNYATLLLLFCTFTFVPYVSCQSCTAGWSLKNGRCYRVFEGSKNWYDSQQACISYAGDLVVIKSMDLQNQLTLMVVGSLGSYWIGLQYNNDNQGFYWVDSTPLNPNVTRWNIGEPNSIGSGTDCVEMYGTSGLWNDEHCTSSAGYICERGTDILKKCDEDNGWASANGKCYKMYMNTDREWEGAKAYCRSVDGDLVDVNSADEQNIVTAASQLSGVSFWIGLTNKYYSDANTFKWSTGQPVTFDNWATGEPAGRFFDTDGDCAQVLDTAINGEWSTTKCTDSRNAFLCERAEGTCYPGWRIHKGNCYQFNSHTQLTYTDAKHTCEAQGAFLVSIFSGEDNDYIVSQFEGLQNIGITDIWIGIADYPDDGVFKWSDNSAVTYQNWNDETEPADTVGQHDCGMIYTGDTSGKWNTNNCFVLKAYVCKTRAGQPIYYISPNLPVGDCPAGWNLFGDSCYYSDTSRSDWNSAEAKCVNQNAHLVAINDDDEQSYISMRVAGIGVNTWIGLHDSGNRDNFVWTDGSTLDLSNWASGNPNYDVGGEACVAAMVQDNKEGLWDDLSCSDTKTSICEKPKECETYTSRTTDLDFYYRYHPSPLPTNRVEFQVRASNDVHISLSSSNTGQGQMYEVVIGGWSNTQSVIRTCGQCAHVAEVQTIGILSASEFRGFVITYESNGYIAVYKYGEGIPFMFWTDPNPFQINYVGYSTGYGSEGEYKFCDLDAGSSGTVNVGPTPAFDSRCGSGWEYDSSSGNCYLFQPYRYLSWTDAEIQCNLGGGNLISIGGSSEMNYILGRMAVISESRLWIGASDTNREGGWTWSDGSGFTFLNWAPGEPNDANEVEHCAEMYVNTGTWNDIECTAQLGYVCKKNGYLVDNFNVYHSMYLDGYDNLQLTNIYPEECAKQCIQQSGFTCRSIEYNTKTMDCSLSDASNLYSGVSMTYMEDIDYYERPVGEQCPSGWDMFQSKCYFFDKHARKKWYEARSECQAMDADLVVIKSSEVENWITTQIVSLDGGYWIGLHDQSDEGDFEWVDGTKLSETGFSRWDLRQPDNYGEEGEDCVEIWTSGLWNDDSCITSMEGLICDKDTIYDVSLEEIPPTLSPIYRCPVGWKAYGDYCFYVQLSEGSWENARDQCRSLSSSSELASIHNSNENEFVAALVAQSGVTGPLTHFWIGMNDLRVSLTFEWVDGTATDYTYWNDNEPNNFLGADEDCVEMDGGGAWNDERCSMINPSICKMGKMIIEGTEPPVTPSGCDLGWVSYGSSCYGVPGKVASSWSNAQAACRTAGAYLASIGDRFEQTVVTSILSQENGNPVWIGLNDLTVAGQYQWSDSTAVSYTHWDYQEPKENNGNCVAATSGAVAGLWQVKNCGSRFNYLCKSVRDGYTPAPTVTVPVPTEPNNNNCAPGWIGYGNRCFKVFNFGDLTIQLRNWQIALSRCRAIGGDLASFHSADEENYFKEQVGNLENDGFWIGLHDRSTEKGFEWTDGSVVDYVAWNPDEPNNQALIGEDCVEMRFDGRGWNDKLCTSLKSWVCQIERGKVPSDTPAPPPSLPPYTPCPTAQDWILEGDYCYYLSAGANTRLSWTDANTWCMNNGGYLASIHGQDEQDMLIYYGSTYSYNSHWIGIREYEISGTLSWSDGTPIDYENWNEGEPNDSNGEEQCGEMYASDGLWNDLNCGDPTPFICKRVYNEIIPQTYPITPAPSGYCANGWVQHGHRCYRIYGQSSSDKRTWYDARDNCNSLGGELAIIHAQDIQSFLITIMKGIEFDIYIGLSDITDNQRFRWVDGTAVDYTNWNRLEPNEAGGEEDCVDMKWNEGIAGKWNDIGCSQSFGYICQKNIEPSNPAPPPVENNCVEGYTPYYESCFKVITSEVSFQTAGVTCQNDGYNLASIQDVYEQSFLETLLYANGGNPLWIGMSGDELTGEYTWQDGWPTFYTNWGFREPSQGINEGCVVVGADGKWDDTRCNQNYGAVCKYTSLPTPTHPPDTPGTCPTGWLTSGNDCFLVKAGLLDLASFPEAQYLCKGYGAQLASIHTALENKIIFDAIFITATDVWLGMDRELDGSYTWIDNTPLNYLNWADYEPSYTADGVIELCAEMYPNNGKWNDRECLQKQGYVCRASKNDLNPSIPPVVTSSREPVGSTVGTPKKQTGLSTGGIVGIVLAVVAAICLALVIIFFFMNQNKSPAVPKDAGLPPSIGFDNALYKSGDKDMTVQIGSTDPTSMDA